MLSEKMNLTLERNNLSMKKLIIILFSAHLFIACQSKKNAEEVDGPNPKADSSQNLAYKPDEDVVNLNVTGDYAYVEKSVNGYTYCEFSIQQLDELSGEFTVTLFENKNDIEYTNPKGSASYPLHITMNDGGQLQVQPEIADVDDWDQSKQKFPGLDKLFFADGSGFPMQNLYRKGKDFIIVQQGSDADSIILKHVKVK